KNYSIMSFMHSLHHTVPAPLRTVVQDVVHEELKSLLMEEKPPVDRLEQLIRLIAKWSFTLPTEDIQFVASEWVDKRVTRFAERPHDVGLLREIENVLTLLESLHLDLDVWRAQNEYFSMSRSIFPQERMKAGQGDPVAQDWVRVFSALGARLQIRPE
ncbi:MAG: hypothetical protein KAJ12_10865, partial [Bacteroidetes bacterium]|nr:hypothetical protein [Bacteroidota bacterium]